MEIESVAKFLNSEHPTAFSFEILPPIRGKSITQSYRSIETLLPYNPAYVNITTHRRQVEYKDAGNGNFQQVTVRRRPGTVAIGASLRERYGIHPVPHLICGEYSCREIEDQLIDLSYLGITDILVLRGDRAHESQVFTTNADGHQHAESLARQVTAFNAGIMCDGTQTDAVVPPFSFGVAGYPEKHEEALNSSQDMLHLKAKVDAGAEYVVTQMFFDNSKYFDFVRRAREAGITVPIIPGIKPLGSLRQMTILPRIFHIDIPDELAREWLKCKTDADVKALGVEWATQQARELKEHGVPSIHFYAVNAVQSVAAVAKNVY